MLHRILDKKEKGSWDKNCHCQLMKCLETKDLIDCEKFENFDLPMKFSYGDKEKPNF